MQKRVWENRQKLIFHANPRRQSTKSEKIMNGKNATGAPSFLDSISPDGRWTNPDGVFSRYAANQRATNAAREISGGCLICTASAVAAPEPETKLVTRGQSTRQERKTSDGEKSSHAASPPSQSPPAALTLQQHLSLCR